MNGEIINADSMQIYKEFSILSSRPRSSETKKKLKHHLYGIVSVKKYFSAGDWLKEVKKESSFMFKEEKKFQLLLEALVYILTLLRKE